MISHVTSNTCLGLKCPPSSMHIVENPTLRTSKYDHTGDKAWEEVPKRTRGHHSGCASKVTDVLTTHPYARRRMPGGPEGSRFHKLRDGADGRREARGTESPLPGLRREQPSQVPSPVKLLTPDLA